MFLLRSTNHVARDLPVVPEDEQPMDTKTAPKPNTLAGLIAEDPFSRLLMSEEGDEDNKLSGEAPYSASKETIPTGNHLDVAEDEGWITIPNSKLPDDWFTASGILCLRSLDRSFVFSGEQLHVLVCLSAAEQEEMLAPFNVTEAISKNDNFVQNKKHENADLGSTSIHPNGKLGGAGGFNGDEEKKSEMINNPIVKIKLSTAEKVETEEDVTVAKSLLQKENHRLQTEILLGKFINSNFFVRIAESDEPLWSKRVVSKPSSTSSDMTDGRHSNVGATRKDSSNFLSAVIDQGSFDRSASGGIARDIVKCCSLPSGDIVVLLQVNVAVSNLKDPVIEVLQFEKYGSTRTVSEGFSEFSSSNSDPYGKLLNWLLPLDRTLTSSLPLTPPLAQAPAPGAQRSTSTSYTGSQIFSFGHIRSYSMPSLPQVSAPTHNSRAAFDLGDFDRFTPEKLKNHDLGHEGLLSFRGVPLVPERFNVHCGLEGIHLPGRRWRRKLEIIQPLEITSFPAACTTEDLLCVQIKNTSPSHLPDIIIFLDSITIISDDASKGSLPFSLPIASIETGNGHSLPNLPLRRGEEHSFILKPSSIQGGHLKAHDDVSSKAPQPKIGMIASTLASKVTDVRKTPPSTDQYAVLVSCRCNYTESKLFFKQTTSWQPHISKDLMISVVSEMSEQTAKPATRMPQLPVQVLTLHASNLTSEDLTLAILAPLSSPSSPSVVPLSSTPATPVNVVPGYSEFISRGGDKMTANMQRLSLLPVVTESQKENDASSKRSVSLVQHTGTTSDFISGADLGYTHLWLQSTVPLGCVPAHSSATVKLELLPLTDGIITLDTLQVAVREKGLTYTPEQPLQIYATTSVATGIL